MYKYLVFKGASNSYCNCVSSLVCFCRSPNQSCKWASFWSPSPTFIFETRKPNLPSESRYAQ